MAALRLGVEASGFKVWGLGFVAAANSRLRI